MEKYLSNGVLIHEGKTYRHGMELSLSDEMAAALGDRVIRSEVADPEDPLSTKTVKELKELAKVAGVTGYSSMDRGELLAVLNSFSVERVSSDEPSGD